jgi:hypothetical protein
LKNRSAVEVVMTMIAKGKSRHTILAERVNSNRNARHLLSLDCRRPPISGVLDEKGESSESDEWHSA